MYSPLIITTWPFGAVACAVGYEILKNGGSAIDAVEQAANVTELDPTVNSVGYGGRPNADGVVELDAAIMDGITHNAGAVAALTGIKNPISVARRVMECTSHVMLAGENARRFAIEQGFPIDEEELLTEESRQRWLAWLNSDTLTDVAHFPDAAALFTEGGIGKSISEPHGRTRSGTHDPANRTHRSPLTTPENHDTIGLCALDLSGNLAAGCTTSGMAWKIPGRVGDSPIIGSGLYVDNEIGAAAGTGHGDEMMKACLSYRVVMGMERGLTPTEACVEALRYLLRKRPSDLYDNYGAAVIALRKDGSYGAAATRSGFTPPHALWKWAVSPHDPSIMASSVVSTQNSEVGANGVRLFEGPYTTLASLSHTLTGD